MARFLIEVPHESEAVACIRAVEILLRTGSHFITHADFGCYDGDHRAWIIVVVESGDEARNTVPVEYRAQARVVKLNRFTLDDIEELKRKHKMH
jgi:hypothetical protein